MARRTIRAYCPRCRHLQPFLRAEFDWKLHILMTVVTVGVWSVCLISAIAKRLIWPWRCEHCGWHEPDFRSPAERTAGVGRALPEDENDTPLRPPGPIVPGSELESERE